MSRTSSPTSQQTYLADLDQQVADAHAAGAFTAVLKLAKGHQDRLQHELADVTRGLALKWVSAAEQTKPSPVEIRINRLRWELRQWDYVADRASEYAANEALGWTILPDGTCAKALDSGNVISSWGGVRYEEEDGTIVDTSSRSDEWLRAHRRHGAAFGERVRAERLATARRGGHTLRTRSRTREYRPGAARRTSSSSSTSGQDPSDPDEPEPPSAGRHCAAPWCSHPVYGSPQKKYCGTEHCDTARAKERQRTVRNGDLTALERERLDDARVAHYVGAEAFGAPREHALSFLWKFALADGSDPGELEALRDHRACRCNGHHIDGGAVGCWKCGLSREAVAA